MNSITVQPKARFLGEKKWFTLEDFEVEKRKKKEKRNF